MNKIELDDPEGLSDEMKKCLEFVLHNICPFTIILYAIRVIVHEIFLEARSLTGYYRDEREFEHERLKKSEWGYLNCFSGKRKNNMSVYMEWFIQNPIRRGTPAYDRGYRVFSKRLKKGRSHNYPRTHVINKDSKNYEERLFDELEPQFSRLRYYNDLVSKFSRSMRDVKRARGKLVGEDILEENMRRY